MNTYGSNRTKINELFKVSPINKMFSETANEIQKQLGSDFARKHYEEFGFIVTENSSLAPQVRQKAGQIDKPPGIGKGWGKYHEDYCKVRVTDRWKDISAEISLKAKLLYEQISKGKTPDNISFRKQISTEISNVLVRVLVARRVVVKCFIEYETHEKVMDLLQFYRRGEEADNTKGDVALNDDNYRNYLNEIGLGKEILERRDWHLTLWQEEMEWLDTFERTDKT